MKADIFTLCDSAQEYQGKLIIVGTFNTILSPEYPVIHPDFAIAARILFDPADADSHHEIKVTITSEKGDDVLLPPEKFSLDINEKKDTESVINVLVKANNIKIPKEGRYTVRLMVDDKEITSTLTAVKQDKL